MWFLVIFNVIVGWNWGTPAILQQNPNKSTLGKFGSKLGIGRPPPPQLGQKPKFSDRFNLKAPLIKAITTIVIFIIVIIMLMRICLGGPSSWRLDVPGGYEPPLPRLLPKLSSSVHHLHLSTSLNIYHRGHWVHLTKASYLHHNNHPQPRQMKMFNYLSLQSPARSSASTWLLWTFSEVESMESPPTTGQKNILFIKVARGYQNWHRRTYLLSMKIIFHHHIQSTFKHMECFGKSIRQ